MVLWANVVWQVRKAAREALSQHGAAKDAARPVQDMNVAILCWHGRGVLRPGEILP